MTGGSLKTRFAPSPTGLMHLGSVRAVLFPYLFAKAQNAIFFIRIDDTDRIRSTQEFERTIFQDLKWLGVDFSYFFRQSERVELYERVFNNLKNIGAIYSCFETEQEINTIRQLKRARKLSPIITRKDLKKTEGQEHWRFDLGFFHTELFEIEDIILGKTSSERVWSDPVIRREDRSFTYVFTSVVDDIEEGVTHIIRGQEHVSNALIQKEIGRAVLGKQWDVNFAHFSLLLDTKGKLSKREGSLTLSELNKIIEPSAIWSVIRSLGTNEKQIFSKDIADYFKGFQLEKLSKTSQRFNFDMLIRANEKILKTCEPEFVKEVEYGRELWELLKNNVRTKQEFFEKSKKVLSYEPDLEKLKEPTVELMIATYEEIFGEKNGPEIKKLIEFYSYLKLKKNS